MKLFKPVLLGLGGVCCIVGIYAYNVWISYDHLFTPRAPERSHIEAEFISKPDSETQAAIIRVMLNELSESDHSVNDDGNVYLAVPNDVFILLPKRINDIGLVHYQGPIGSKERSVSYIAFSHWGIRDEKVFVSRIAYFAGGNIGGCREEYATHESHGWHRVSSDCFAMAS